MQEKHLAFGINERATTIVVKPVLPDQKPDFVWAPEFYLDELDRKGVDFTCRMFGQMALALLRIHHRDAMDRYDIFLAAGATRLIDEDSNIERMPPSDLRGGMLPCHVAVGLSRSGLALAVEEHDGSSGRLAMGRYEPFVKLEALGPETAAMTIGEIILRMLLRQHQHAFAPFHNLSPQPEKGGDLP